jgi:diacylglycerol O-acyltransferase
MATAENPMVIGALVVTDQRLPASALEDTVRRKLLPHARFRRHVVESARPRWRDDPAFELGAHLHASPAPVSEGELARLVGARLGAALPRGRSPWDLQLHDLAGGGSALFARVHHCIGDGQALVSLLADLGGAEPPAPPPARAPFRPWRRVAALARFLSMGDDPATALRGPLSGAKAVAWSNAIPLAKLKTAAHAQGQHLTPILLAAVAGAIARYLRQAGQTPVDVRALMPVAARADGELGNHYSSVYLRLPVSEPEPTRRLVLLADEMRRVRESGLAAGLTGIMGAMSASVERRVVRRWSRKASLVVSSLRGPEEPVQIAGRTVRTVVVWAPTPASIALGLSLFGYAGTLRLGVLADAAVIPDPAALAAALEDEVRDPPRVLF